MADHARLGAFGIDPVALSEADNEKLGDIMEDNDRLTVEVLPWSAVALALLCYCFTFQDLPPFPWQLHAGAGLRGMAAFGKGT